MNTDSSRIDIGNSDEQRSALLAQQQTTATDTHAACAISAFEKKHGEIQGFEFAGALDYALNNAKKLVPSELYDNWQLLSFCDAVNVLASDIDGLPNLLSRARAIAKSWADYAPAEFDVAGAIEQAAARAE